MVESSSEVCVCVDVEKRDEKRKDVWRVRYIINSVQAKKSGFFVLKGI